MKKHNQFISLLQIDSVILHGKIYHFEFVFIINCITHVSYHFLVNMNLIKGSVLNYRFTILSSVLVTKNSDLQQLVTSESRVMLLYCTREEALRILQAARNFKITGENYVWVVTQSVMENLQAPQLFPVGMLG